MDDPAPRATHDVTSSLGQQRLRQAEHIDEAAHIARSAAQAVEDPAWSPTCDTTALLPEGFVAVGP